MRNEEWGMVNGKIKWEFFFWRFNVYNAGIDIY